MATKVEKVQALKKDAVDKILAVFVKAYDSGEPLRSEDLSLQLAIVSAANVCFARAKELDCVENSMIPADFDVNWVNEDDKSSGYLNSGSDWSSQI